MVFSVTAAFSEPKLNVYFSICELVGFDIKSEFFPFAVGVDVLYLEWIFIARAFGKFENGAVIVAAVSGNVDGSEPYAERILFTRLDEHGN